MLMTMLIMPFVCCYWMPCNTACNTAAAAAVGGRITNKNRQSAWPIQFMECIWSLNFAEFSVIGQPARFVAFQFLLFLQWNL